MDHSDSPRQAPTPAPAPMAGLYDSLSALAYVMTGNQAHSRLRSESGLTVDRGALALLRALARAGSPLRMGELAERLMVKAPHVTREVRRLEERGLVETAPEPGDQRVRRAAITREGREAVARAEETGRQWLTDALGDFSADELRTTAAVIDRIVDTYRH